MKNIYLILISVIFLSGCLDNSVHMQEGNYPFQVVDSVVFNNSVDILQFNQDQKPEEFISIMEERYRNSFISDFWNSNYSLTIVDSTSYLIKLNRAEKEKYWKAQRMIEIHRETNSRSFIAGVTNHSNDTMSFPIQDESIIAILEAKDHNEEWKPIQFWPISRCGNSFYSIYINPGQTLLITVENVFGKTPTELRIRLHGNDTIYVSNTFKGKIDPSNFIIPDNIIERYDHILCDSIFFLEKPMYGDLNNDEMYDFIIYEDEKK